jgi:transcriptional regulator with XRE-family HTH domain
VLASPVPPLPTIPTEADVSDPDRRLGLFPAQLRYWRRQRGLSQLDLALAADVSARHVSFLETGRAMPSPEMVVQLAVAMGVPLRQVNAMLRAAGHDPVYDEDEESLPASVVAALSLLKDHHEPYPVIVLDRTYRVRDLNRAAHALLGTVLATGTAGVGDEPGRADPAELNLARVTFDPAGARPSLVNFETVGRHLLWRIQREVLADPDDDELRDLLDELLAMPTVDPGWRQVDLAVASDPALVLHLRGGGLDLRFLAMMTAFQAPQNVAVEHLRIETWFPVDPATADACRVLGAGRGAAVGDDLRRGAP